MAKWAILALSPDGSIQDGEYESESASSALLYFEDENHIQADDWVKIKIYRLEDAE